MGIVESQRGYKAKIIDGARRVTIKVGSSLLSDTQGIRAGSVAHLARGISALRTSQREVVLVTSGAIVAGCARLGIASPPQTIPAKQAAAAVGQITLMALYEAAFAKHNCTVAQILLTHDDLANRRRYLNAKHALFALLQAGTLPIVNENDTVAVDEIQFGENDHLSALVAVLIEADLLIILSDVAGLYERDPRTHADARLISLVDRFDDTLLERGGRAGPLGKGGMASKIHAAQLASLSGIPTIIADGRSSDALSPLFDPGVEAGTLFLPTVDRITSRKHWIAYTLKPAGSLRVDHGARRAVSELGRSLLPAGVLAVNGTFETGDCVSCFVEGGREFARGLVNYSSVEIARIRGAKTNQIEQILGYSISDEIIHRDDLALV